MKQVKIADYGLLEKLLNQRLNEMLDSMHRPELKGQLVVKIVDASMEPREPT